VKPAFGPSIALAACWLACSDPSLPTEPGAGGGGAGGDGTIASSSAAATTTSGQGAAGGGGAPPVVPLEIEIVGGAFPRAFERATLPVRVRVTAPVGSAVELRLADGVVAEATTARTEEELVLGLPLSRGPRTVDAVVSSAGGDEAATSFDVYGGRPVAAALDRMLLVEDGALLEWGAGDPSVRTWSGLPSAATSIHARDASALVVHEDGSVSRLDLVAGSVTTVSAGEDVVAAALGGGHALLLLRDGSVLAAGANGAGQLGAGHADAVEGWVPVVDIGSIVAIAAAEGTSYAVDASGTIYAWGANDDGQLGLGDVDDAPHPTPATVFTLSDVEAVAAGRDHVIVLHGDGTMSSWGVGSSGQLGNGSSGILADRSQPVAVESTLVMLDVFAAANTSYAVDDAGLLWAWGQNSLAQLGVGDTNAKTTPSENGMSFAAAVGPGATGGIALDASGAAFVWGSNASAQLALPPPPRGPARSPTPVEVVVP
jgi:hypothetical protein